MIYYYDPDKIITTFHIERCAYHRKFPGERYAGCTCSGGITTREATPEEYEENKRKRIKNNQALVEYLSIHGNHF